MKIEVLVGCGAELRELRIGAKFCSYFTSTEILHRVY